MQHTRCQRNGDDITSVGVEFHLALACFQIPNASENSKYIIINVSRKLVNILEKNKKGKPFNIPIGKPKPNLRLPFCVACGLHKMLKFIDNSYY